jgi:glucuronoarabinoxylan endo-1,4-beta-xylanase
MVAWVGGALGQAFAGSAIKIMAPETQNFCSFPGFASALQNDAAAWSAVSIVATHEYGCTPAKSFAAAAQAGKEYWETEIYDNVHKTADNTMLTGLWVANEMYDALANANMNAWHYWWFYPGSNDNGALWDFATKTPSKRLWVMGNFSRFVRPGFYRVDVTGTRPAGVSVIAFQNPADATIAVVAINTNTTATPIALFVSGSQWPAQVVPWVTSNSDNLAAKPAIPVQAANFSATLDAESVTTFVGQP